MSRRAKPIDATPEPEAEPAEPTALDRLAALVARSYDLASRIYEGNDKIRAIDLRLHELKEEQGFVQREIDDLIAVRRRADDGSPCKPPVLED